MVLTPNRLSAPEPVRVEATAPGILAIVGTRREGMPVTIYATGLGPVTPPAVTGGAAPLRPLSTTVIEPVLSIGGARAALTFSGLAPLFAGLYQVNAVVPAGLPAGPADVVLEAGGRRSNVVRWTTDQ